MVLPRACLHGHDFEAQFVSILGYCKLPRIHLYETQKLIQYPFSASTCGPDTDPGYAHSVNTRQDIMPMNLRGAVLIFPPPEDSITICQSSVATNWNRCRPNNLVLALQEEKLRVCITKVLSSLSFFSLSTSPPPLSPPPPPFQL